MTPKNTTSTKTTLRLDAEMHRRLRHLAIERETTLAALVEAAVRDLLAREESKEEVRS